MIKIYDYSEIFSIHIVSCGQDPVFDDRTVHTKRGWPEWGSRQMRCFYNRPIGRSILF